MNKRLDSAMQADEFYQNLRTMHMSVREACVLIHMQTGKVVDYRGVHRQLGDKGQLSPAYGAMFDYFFRYNRKRKRKKHEQAA